ncbi:MAG: hypothetical protein ACJ76I_12245 [Gaiellaceae bacterium]
MHSLRERALLVMPIRIVLGVALFALARIAGSHATAALLAFATGLIGIVFFLFNDPRARFASGAADALPLPEEATLAPRWRQALAATIPSTIGVAALSVIALFSEPTLGALLAGIEAGLGVAAAFSLMRIDPALHVDPRSRAVYRR